MTNVSKLKQTWAFIDDIEREESAVRSLAAGTPAAGFSCVSHFARALPDGVGFALVRNAIGRMEGRLWFESDPTHGHCFKIELRQD